MVMQTYFLGILTQDKTHIASLHIELEIEKLT